MRNFICEWCSRFNFPWRRRCWSCNAPLPEPPRPTKPTKIAPLKPEESAG